MKTASEAIRPLEGAPGDYDALIERIGDARFVLIGEASHGTHEFYRERAEITLRLIVEKGFNAVAAEADRPDTERQSHYFHARLTDQFDVMLPFDATRALAPLDPVVAEDSIEAPETYPTGK